MESLETSCPIGEESRFLKNLSPILNSLYWDDEKEYRKGYDDGYNDGRQSWAERYEAH
jgi:hypothetical protein